MAASNAATVKTAGETAAHGMHCGSGHTRRNRRGTAMRYHRRSRDNSGAPHSAMP